MKTSDSECHDGHESGGAEHDSWGDALARGDSKGPTKGVRLDSHLLSVVYQKKQISGEDHPRKREQQVQSL